MWKHISMCMSYNITVPFFFIINPFLLHCWLENDKIAAVFVLLQSHNVSEMDERKYMDQQYSLLNLKPFLLLFFSNKSYLLCHSWTFCKLSNKTDGIMFILVVLLVQILCFFFLLFKDNILWESTLLLSFRLVVLTNF